MRLEEAAARIEGKLDLLLDAVHRRGCSNRVKAAQLLDLGTALFTSGTRCRMHLQQSPVQHFPQARHTGPMGESCNTSAIFEGSLSPCRAAPFMTALAPKA